VAWQGLAWPGGARQGTAGQGQAGHGEAGVLNLNNFQLKQRKSKTLKSNQGLTAKRTIANNQERAKMPREILYKVNVGLEGVTSLLQHKCGLIKTGGEKAPDTDYSEEWKKTTYVNSEGFVSVPSLNIEAMMKDAAKSRKIGKLTMRQVVASGTAIEEWEPEIVIKNKKVTIKDIEDNDWKWSSAVGIKGDRVTRVRTCLPSGWQVFFTVSVYTPSIKKEILKNLFERAGYEQGLMDFRPGAKKPGKFGQFELIKFEIK
jgi:hypothetical protein